jgi:hypothetical protein
MDEPWFAPGEVQLRRRYEEKLPARQELHIDEDNVPEPEPTPESLSKRLARDMRRACNSVLAVMGVVEPKMPSPDDLLILHQPSLETRELEEQREAEGMKIRSGSGWMFVGHILGDLGCMWLAGLQTRLIVSAF